jgi:uncharacterized DUF497 family protein
MECEWDADKAAANLVKHGVRFADAAVALEDPFALTITDTDSVGEDRYITLAADPVGNVLVIVYAQRGDNIRMISSRKAS